MFMQVAVYKCRPSLTYIFMVIFHKNQEIRCPQVILILSIIKTLCIHMVVIPSSFEAEASTSQMPFLSPNQQHHRTEGKIPGNIITLRKPLKEYSDDYIR